MDSHSSNIQVNSNHNAYTVNQQKITALTNDLLSELGLNSYELNIEFVDAPKIQTLNKEFRGKDQSTDVLSFPQKEWDSPITIANKAPQRKNPEIPDPLGDIVISIDDASNNAQNIGQSLDREVAFLIAHGLLHLAGHDHMKEEEEKLMLEQQQFLMSCLSSDSSLPKWDSCIHAEEKSC